MTADVIVEGDSDGPKAAAEEGRQVQKVSKQVKSGASVGKSWWRAIELTTPIAKQRHRILPTLIGERAAEDGDRVALLSDGQNLSYGALFQLANRYARWAAAQGLRKSECVCLLMPNCPEYLAIWLGIISVGGVVALLNADLTGSSLAHCINAVSPSHIVVAADCMANFQSTRSHLDKSMKVWLHGNGTDELPRIDVEISDYAEQELANRERPPITLGDCALYVYTSGTTGLPKAAKITHYRIMEWAHWFAGMLDIQSADRMYDCLPMYHSVGGLVATASLLVKGGSVVIDRRFSAHRFWDRVIEWDCTMFQYIGELCRYLVHAPFNPQETRHRIRVACGNGLRLDVWDQFKERFKIPQILEFYAATEGNVSLYNVEQKPGAVGRIPLYLEHRFPIDLIKMDPESGEPMRGEDGFCIPCAADEVGEAIGSVVSDRAHLARHFDGYVNSAESDEKILRDVFKAGDAWFRTGDLMRKDNQRYFFFIDRIGDTFRCKGHNVSAAEVAQILLDCPGILDAVVYGVAVPGMDGRIGMAAIAAGSDFNLTELPRYLDARLPRYAQPAFLRLCRGIGLTSTLKHNRADLVAKSYGPDLEGDGLYIRSKGSDVFNQIDQPLYDAIQMGKIPI